MAFQKNLPVRVLIADDHPMVREWFAMTYKKDKEIEVIATAANGAELIEMAGKLKPDVIITDIRMPAVDGIQATKILSERFQSIPVIAFSVIDSNHLIVEMLEAGAKGYLQKSADREELLKAIRVVRNNKTYYCTETSTRLGDLIANSKILSAPKKEYKFSKREKQLIQHICDGKSNKEIAAVLRLSPRTVETYRKNVMEKMDVSNTAGIVVTAIRAGIYIVNYNMQ